MMEEQMRLMSEEAKSLQVTGEVMQRIVEHVVRMRLMAENMKKQASDDDLQRVEKMERGLKVFMEEVRDRQKEWVTRVTKEQNVTMSPEDEVGRKVTREGRGCAGLVQERDETHRMNETCGKGKGKGNGGKGEPGGTGEDGGKGIQQQSMKLMKGEEEQVTDEEDERVQVAPNIGAGGSHPQAMLDPEVEAVEEKEGTRKLRWADCEEEEGARQGVTEGEWHKARKEQGIVWLVAVLRNRKDMRDQPEMRGVSCVDEWRCGARNARCKKGGECGECISWCGKSRTKWPRKST